MATRAEIDAIAWKTIHATHVVRDRLPSGYAVCGRPRNYTEFGQMVLDREDYEQAWSEFLHEFFRFRTASFFSDRPPRFIGPGQCAILAGTAEYLSKDFGLPVPAWTEEPEYFLPELWDPMSDWCPGMEEFREIRIAKANECFLRRNVIFESRNLITL
jgi:hypothetical protein